MLVDNKPINREGEMEDRKRRLVERINHLIEGISNESRGDPLDQWPDIELTMPQTRVLGFLYSGPKRTGELARFLGSSLSAATTMVDRLVRRNLVERTTDPDDRRVVICRLSQAGVKAVEEFSKVRRLRLEKVSAVLSVEELEIVSRAMEILSVGLDRLEWSAGIKDEAAQAS
jgi:DNA-binding MarR family transcriptional regulator